MKCSLFKTIEKRKRTMMTPRVAAIHDMSGFGRCSLTVAIPILSAMGVQCCPLPTAFLSTHTGGFEGFTFLDMTDEMSKVADHWASLGLTFQAVYSGFLGSERQIGVVEDFICRFRGPDTVVVVDPVMGDYGRVYQTYTAAMCSGMARLAELADVITPNLTEACILAGVGYEEAMRSDGLEAVRLAACALREQGPSTVVITGIPRGEQIVNAVFSPQGEHLIATRRLGDGFSGTGDILASVLCGGLARKMKPQAALDLAAALLQKAIAHTFAEGTDPNDGVAFEPYLYLLTDREAYQ